MQKAEASERGRVSTKQSLTIDIYAIQIITELLAQRVASWYRLTLMSKDEIHQMHVYIKPCLVTPFPIHPNMIQIDIDQI